jgi:periplasmic protein TonB
MVLTLSIMAIIVAFSLYDYFSSRSWQMVTSKERNETVFENRNKEYGAYQIRRDYDKRILLVFLGVTVGIGALWGASTLFKPLEQRKQIEIPMETWTADLKTEDEKPEIPEVVEQPAAAPSQAEIAEFRELVVTDDDQDKNVLPPDGNTAIGNQAQTGDPGTIWDEPTIVPPGKGGEGKIEVKVPDNKIHETVDEDAIFPGGMKALRQFIADNIDLSMIEGSSKISLKFVVDTNGEISTVIVTRNTGDCESCEKAAIKVVKSMPKWTPGKVNGEPVRSYYRLPINIQ